MYICCMKSEIKVVEVDCDSPNPEVQIGIRDHSFSIFMHFFTKDSYNFRITCF